MLFDKMVKVIQVEVCKKLARQVADGNALSSFNRGKEVVAGEIFDQPTRGVDIGATEYIHQRLIAQREEGTATLLISEDLDEVQNLSDRIAVIYKGEIMGIVARGEATVEELGLMMAGVRRTAQPG